MSPNKTQDFTALLSDGPYFTPEGEQMPADSFSDPKVVYIVGEMKDALERVAKAAREDLSINFDQILFRVAQAARPHFDELTPSEAGTLMIQMIVMASGGDSALRLIREKQTIEADWLPAWDEEEACCVGSLLSDNDDQTHACQRKLLDMTVEIGNEWLIKKTGELPELTWLYSRVRERLLDHLPVSPGPLLQRALHFEVGHTAAQIYRVVEKQTLINKQREMLSETILSVPASPLPEHLRTERFDTGTLLAELPPNIPTSFDEACNIFDVVYDLQQGMAQQLLSVMNASLQTLSKNFSERMAKGMKPEPPSYYTFYSSCVAHLTKTFPTLTLGEALLVQHSLGSGISAQLSVVTKIMEGNAVRDFMGRLGGGGANFINFGGGQ